MKRRYAVFLVLVFVSLFFAERYRSHCIDPSLLADVILSSNRLCLFDSQTETVLYNSSDVEEISWLSKVFVADKHSPHMVCMAKIRYKLLLYNEDDLIATIGFQKKLRFHWFNPGWDHDIDFLLTPRSYGEVLPWLCAKSKLGLNELFPLKFPFQEEGEEGSARGKKGRPVT